MKNFFVFLFCCIFFFGLLAKEDYEVIVKPGTCAPGQEYMEMKIEREGQEPVVKIVPCPKKIEEEVPEIPTVIRLLGEKSDKNYFFGSMTYRLVSEDSLNLHIPVFSGGFMSYPFIKDKAGVKLSLGYGIPSNSDGYRNMLEWKLAFFIKTYKDILNVNVGYLGSMSWGKDSLSRNESAGMIEIEYFIIKNLSLSIGGFVGGSQDTFYVSDGSWQVSGGLIVSTSVRF